MMNVDGARADGETLEAVRDAAVAAAPVPGAVLRDIVVDLAFEPAGSTRIPLDDFLSEPSWGVALRLWFGDDGLLRVPSRSRILRAIDCDIARLDALLTEQVNEILHNPRLQKLEA